MKYVASGEHDGTDDVVQRGIYSRAAALTMYYFDTDARSHNCGDNAFPRKTSCWIKAFLRGLLQPQKSLITGRLGAREGKFHSLWPFQPLWYEQITISPLVFDTVGSHTSSFVCLFGLYMLLLVKCSHTRAPRPLRLGTKQTKGLFALPCARSCDEA